MKHTLLSISLFLSMIGNPTGAQVISEKLTFPGARGNSFPYMEEVSATLQKPENSKGKLPAIVLLHGSGGIDGRGEWHAAELNKNGFATLEVFMFAANGRPKGGHSATLTHAYGALKYLASREDINPQAIGVMGFSWGGNMALRMASKSVHDAFSADVGGLGFFAHAPLYPVCWSHLKLAQEPNSPGYGAYTAFTGAPVLLFAGGQDDYGDADDCKKFVEAVDKNAKGVVQLQFYPDATHGWDSPPSRSRTIYDSSAHQGKGGQVRMWPDARVANDSRMRVVSFFKQHLKTPAQ